VSVKEIARIFIDGGSWYPWALNVVRFKRYTVVSFGPRSAIERLFGDIEVRIRRSGTTFIGKYSRDSMERWIKAFAGLRNWTRRFERSLKLKVSGHMSKSIKYPNVYLTIDFCEISPFQSYYISGGN